LGGENAWEHVHATRPRLKLLTAQELREVSERGAEVGSHTMTHRKLPDLDPAAVNQELGESRRILGEIVGEAVEGFSYPYGGTSEKVLEAVHRAGYDYACAWNELDSWRRHHVPRIPVFEKDDPLRFAAKIRIYWPYRNLANRVGGRRIG
jgi:peptidoglycan/xylan/chitin deacetylase (PgdA/CDA1 family)